jgi:hypothetical protein
MLLLLITWVDLTGRLAAVQLLDDMHIEYTYLPGYAVIPYIDMEMIQALEHGSP